MKPFVKWAGGKRQLINEIIREIESVKINQNFKFYEVFVGGGAVFLHLQNRRVLINDINKELMEAYEVIRDEPIKLMKRLDDMLAEFNRVGEDYYYHVRSWDRDIKKYNNLSKIERASRLIFLNKTCYNGLYRVNSLGQFNTPIGRPTNVSFYEEQNINELSNYFNSRFINIKNTSYNKQLYSLKFGDIVYLDPPYHYENENGFTSYQKEGFNLKDLINLKTRMDRYILRGASFILSNNETTAILNMFEKDENHLIYFIKNVDTMRMINSNAELRDNGKELIITGIAANYVRSSDFEKLHQLIKLGSNIDFNNVETIKELLEIETIKEVYNLIATAKHLGLIDNYKKITSKAEIIALKNIEVFKKELLHIFIKNSFYKTVLDDMYAGHSFSCSFEKNRKNSQIYKMNINETVVNTLEDWIKAAIVKKVGKK